MSSCIKPRTTVSAGASVRPAKGTIPKRAVASRAGFIDNHFSLLQDWISLAGVLGGPVARPLALAPQPRPH